MSMQDVPSHRHINWEGYESVLGCGPHLIRSGKIVVSETPEGFRDPHVFMAMSRSMLGYNSQGRLFLVSVEDCIRFKEMAAIMQALGCHEAMGLDGGASTAMYFRGKFIVPAGRPLVNLLVVYENVPPQTRMKSGKVTDKIKLQPTSADQWYARGKELINARRYKDAAQAFSNACQLNPTAANYRQLAQAESLAGNRQKAAAAYVEAGRVYYKQNLFNEAVVMCKKALAEQRNYTDARRLLEQAQSQR